MNHTQKGNSTVIIIVVVAILAIIGYFLYSGNLGTGQVNGDITPTPTNTGSISASTLLEVRTEGGLCLYGQCLAILKINKDGSYTTERGTEKGVGNLSAASTSRLQNLIDNTNFEDIRQRPFTGTCPIAYDGSKYVYSFQTRNGVETLDSCVSDMDMTAPLFAEVEAIVQTAYGQNGF